MHNLIIGRSRTGKTFLANKIVEKLGEWGNRVVVFDPLCFALDEWQGADAFYNDKQEFLKDVVSNTNTIYLIEEVSINLNQKDDWLLAMGRHWGHEFILLAQRAQQIQKTQRQQCDAITLFAQGKDDSKLLAEEYHEDLNKAKDLPRYHCLSYLQMSPEGVITSNGSDIDKMAEHIADQIHEDRCEPNEGLMTLINMYGAGGLNWDYLREKRWYYEVKKPLILTK